MSLAETRLFGIRVFASNVKDASTVIVTLARRGIGGMVVVTDGETFFEDVFD